jgi:hypothetical protein
VLDTTAPAQTFSNLDISADTGSSASDFNTSTASQTITATLSAALGSNETLWGSTNNGSTYTEITNKVTGTSISWNGATLSGSSNILLEVRDLAGNIGTPTTQAYVLDSSNPTQTISAVDISNDTGISATDNVTTSAAQSITATLSAGLGANDSLWGSLNGGTT